MAPGSNKVEFPGSQDAKLAARLDLPEGKPVATALFAHCFTCGKDILAASRIAGGLAEEGFAVLRFDFTGLGHSEGEFANTNFSSNVEDLLRAVDYLRQFHEAPKLLIGHSLGGAAVLAAAGSAPEATAVATIGAPSEPGHVEHLLSGSVDEIDEAGEAEVSIGGRSFRVRKQFLEDISGHSLRAGISSMKKALMVLHSPVDQTVGIDNASDIFLAAKHPKSFVSLDRADHLLSNKADALYVARVLSAWASRYVAAPRTGPGSSRTDVPRDGEGEVVVEETLEGRFTQTILAGGHHLRADEPESFGGLGSGPTPYDFLLAGLGACTSMTLRLYAERKNWPLDKVRVQLRHEKIHAEDCADCETREGKVDQITREIALSGSLDESQRERLKEIANKCPVHRTLESEIKVRTELVPQSEP